MPMEPYAPAMFDEVWDFCRRLKWPGYVKEIIKWHTDEGMPGSCWVWRRGRKLVAFCGLRFLNRQDAWLYGMRVARDAQGKGVARRFTRELFGVAARSGRTWVGINTYHYTHRPSSVYTIADHLGMKLDATHAVDAFWDLPKGISGPRPRPFSDIYRHYRTRGESVLFFGDHGLLWRRLLPRRRGMVNQGGYTIAGTPVHIASHEHGSTSVNLLDRPGSFADVLSATLSKATARKKWVTLCYPAQWSRRVRRTVRGLLPRLKQGRNYWPSAWRIYGKYLDRRQA